MGVMKPYQLQNNELVPDDIFGFYRYLNGAESLVYTFTPSDGSESSSITKTTGIKKIHALGEEADPAVYEFYSVFAADTLKAGVSYDVTIQAYDRKGMMIPKATCKFTLDN